MKHRSKSLPPKKPENHKVIREKVLELETAIEGYGITLEYRSDFAVLRDTAKEITDLADVTGVFNEDCCVIGPDNGFWLQATDHTGHIVHRQAIRLDDLTGSSLADHWRDNPEIFAPAGYDIAFDKSDFNTAPIAEQITGRVCYHGEFWLDQPYRKMDLASLLSKFATLKALAQFSPDYIYGFVPPKLIERGWAARQGYLHVHPWAPRWRIRKKPDYYDEYLVWISGPELTKLWTTRKRNIDVLSRKNVTENSGSAIMKHVTG